MNSDHNVQSPRSSELSRRFNWIVAVISFIVIAVAVFLIIPFETLNVHPAVLVARQSLRDWLIAVWPIFAVAVFGASVGIAELSATFVNSPKEAIVTRWGQLLILLNAGTAGLAFLVIRSFYPDLNLLLLIIGVGVGFPTLIRTNFTYARQLGGEGSPDSTINVGWLYEQFQKLCKDQIDRELLTSQQKHVVDLLKRNITLDELYNTALYVIQARATLTPEEEKKKRKELKEAIDPKVPPDLAKLTLGQLILELGGVEFIDAIMKTKDVSSAISPAAQPMASMTGASEPPKEDAIKLLTALPIAELKQLAIKALPSDEDKRTIKEYEELGFTEARVKDLVANFLVNKIGAKAARDLIVPK